MDQKGSGQVVTEKELGMDTEEGQNEVRRGGTGEAWLEMTSSRGKGGGDGAG